MENPRRAVHSAALSVVILTLALAVLCEAAVAGPGEASECESRTMRVSFYTCAEGFAECLTKQGHQPIPFRTVAVGDRGLLGRWLYVEDLGGWVLAADTGAALRKNSIDVFIGEGRMARYAARLGVQHWNVRVCAPVPVAHASGSPQAVPRVQAAASTQASDVTEAVSHFTLIRHTSATGTPRARATVGELPGPLTASRAAAARR
jgi:3D (Asp-Asp-Asp) domain-containing protein